MTRIVFKVYRYLISGFIHLLSGPGFGCRFFPTCSEYAVEALEVHGWLRGTALVVRRVFACHPWGRHGFDPVPSKKNDAER